MKASEPRAYPAPAPGDIVWCRFPQREDIKPGPKPRPALVLSVMDDADPLRVRVAYGTTQRLDRVRPTEFVIGADHPAAYALAGLSHPTKFCFTNVVILPYNELWFAPAPGIPPKPDPRMGSLHASLVKIAERAFRSIQDPLRTGVFRYR